MSLYSGITFGSSVAKSGSGSKDDAISVDAASGNNARDAAGKTAAQADADKYAAEQAANAAREQQESNRKAALGFQPVVRKRPAAGSAALKPRMATTTTMAAVAAGPSVSSTANASSSVDERACDYDRRNQHGRAHAHCRAFNDARRRGRERLRKLRSGQEGTRTGEQAHGREQEEQGEAEGWSRRRRGPKPGMDGRVRPRASDRLRACHYRLACERHDVR